MGAPTGERFGQLIQRRIDCLPVVVDHFAAGDGKQPGGKGALVTITRQGFQGRQEGLRGQVFGIGSLPGTGVVVAVDRSQVLAVQRAKGGRVAPAVLDQPRVFLDGLYVFYACITHTWLVWRVEL